MPDNERMSFRSHATLAAWLAEFQALGYPVVPPARVIEQDGAGGANTGLVAVELTGGLSAYIEPDGEPGRWAVTIASSEHERELPAADVARLSAELATVAALCTFLDAKASAAD